MDLLTREVVRAGQKIELQPREFALLEYLMRNPGKVVTKAMILEHIFDYSFDPQTNVVDVLVHRLRSKIDKEFPKKLIQTYRGIGYALKPNPLDHGKEGRYGGGKRQEQDETDAKLQLPTESLVCRDFHGERGRPVFCLVLASLGGD
jgi:DNA-binding winged helix-turn-helix (wHTH) protein